MPTIYSTISIILYAMSLGLMIVMWFIPWVELSTRRLNPRLIAGFMVTLLTLLASLVSILLHTAATAGG